MRVVGCLFCLLFFLVPRPSSAFEKIALMDSLDMANWCDVETKEGTVRLIEDAMRPHPTRILWRDKGACWMRYPCAEEPYPDCEFPIDKRRPVPRPGVYWALRLDRMGFDVFSFVFEECRKRGLDSGIHTTYEENHFYINSSMSVWNLKHPQYWACAKDSTPWSGNVSMAYPEVMEHKLRLVDERLRMRPAMILLDMWRDGYWTPRLEYVAPTVAKWRALYGCEPPDDAKDPRWLKLVSDYITCYIREFARRCHAAGTEFVVGFPDMDVADRSIWERYALDWKALAADGTFDGVWVMNVRYDRAKPFESSRTVYEYVMRNRGKAKVYFSVNWYDMRRDGIKSYARHAKVSEPEAARRLLDLARDVGGAGVVYECVDCHCYPKAVCDALKD